VPRPCGSRCCATSSPSAGAASAASTPARSRSPGSTPPTAASRRSGSRSPELLALDQFDLVAVGILDEGDHGGAVLHRARLAGDLHALGAQCLAGVVRVLDAESDVAVAAP